MPPAANAPLNAGSRTSTPTVNRSSTTSQPTAACPWGVCSTPRSTSKRMSTTVLATETAMPKSRPAVSDRPKTTASTVQNAAAATI